MREGAHPPPEPSPLGRFFFSFVAYLYVLSKHFYPNKKILNRGYVIDKDGLHPTKGKIEAIKNARMLQSWEHSSTCWTTMPDFSLTCLPSLHHWTPYCVSQPNGRGETNRKLHMLMPSRCCRVIPYWFTLTCPRHSSWSVMPHHNYGVGLSYPMSWKTRQSAQSVMHPGLWPLQRRDTHNLTRKDWPYCNHCIISSMRRRPFLLKSLLACRGEHLLLMHISTP